MKSALKLFFGFLLFFAFSFKYAHADTIVPGGNITSNTPWTLAGSPYIIQGNVTVNSNVTLTIESGVSVKFAGFYSLSINGILNATGNPSNNIIFSSNNASPGIQDWQGIRFATAQASSSVLSYVQVRNASNAVTLDNSSPNINNISVTNNNTAFNINNSFSTITAVTVSNNSTGFFMSNGAPVITNSTISNNNYGFVLQHTSSLVAPTVNQCIIHSNAARNVDNTGGFSTSASVSFQNNWWGTTDPVLISQSIFDHYDQEIRPYIDFTPFLNGAGGSPIGTSVTGPITQNTTWTVSGSPYYIGANNVTVNSGVTLTIQEGVAVRVEANYSLRVSGVLNAQGTPSNFITFFSVNPNSVNYYVSGLQLIGVESSASQISYIRISSAYTGLVIKNGSSPVISYIKIDQNRTGIEIDRAGGADPNPEVHQSSIHSNIDTNVRVVGNYLNPSRVLNFERNWWGTTSESSIDSSIVDHMDDAALATIDYIPYLASEGGGITTIHDVSRSPEVLDHKLGETVSIYYTLESDANVTVRIFTDNGITPLVRTLFSGQFRSAGAHTEIWDGRNNQGALLPYDAYFFSIQAVTVPGGVNSTWDDSFSTAPFICISNASTQGNVNFNPYKNEKLPISYTVIKPGTQLIRVRNSAGEIQDLDNTRIWRATGTHTVYWNGRYANGLPYSGAYFLFFDIPQALRKNTMILRSSIEPPTDFLANAYLILSRKLQASVLTYSLDEQVLVTVAIRDPNGNHFRTLVNNQLQSAGSKTLTWDGLNDLGEAASIEGSYRAIITLTHPVSGATVNWTGNISVFQ